MKPIIEMFWVAEYWDGSALPQLDPFSGIENSYSLVNHKHVKRFWWMPITVQMAGLFPGTHANPRLCRHGVDLNGSKGFVARRVEMTIGKDGRPPVAAVKCYVLGIEGGPRQEIYPDGSVISRNWPGVGETQDLLHHG